MVTILSAKRKANTIGTHSGTFHCDEALGCFLLHQVGWGGWHSSSCMLPGAHGMYCSLYPPLALAIRAEVTYSPAPQRTS
jgi:hypothetical protein